MGLVELFLSVLIVGVSGVNASIPLAAWVRLREVRFIWVALANLGLASFGAGSAWAELPGGIAGPSPVPEYGLILVLLAALLFLASSVWPRRT